MAIEHPTGALSCVVELDGEGQVVGAGVVRTARKLFDGTVFARSEGHSSNPTCQLEEPALG